MVRGRLIKSGSRGKRSVAWRERSRARRERARGGCWCSWWCCCRGWRWRWRYSRPARRDSPASRVVDITPCILPILFTLLTYTPASPPFARFFFPRDALIILARRRRRRRLRSSLSLPLSPPLARSRFLLPLSSLNAHGNESTVLVSSASLESSVSPACLSAISIHSFPPPPLPPLLAAQALHRDTTPSAPSLSLSPSILPLRLVSSRASSFLFLGFHPPLGLSLSLARPRHLFRPPAAPLARPSPSSTRLSLFLPRSSLFLALNTNALNRRCQRSPGDVTGVGAPPRRRDRVSLSSFFPFFPSFFPLSLSLLLSPPLRLFAIILDLTPQGLSPLFPRRSPTRSKHRRRTISELWRKSSGNFRPGTPPRVPTLKLERRGEEGRAPDRARRTLEG